MDRTSRSQCGHSEEPPSEEEQNYNYVLKYCLENGITEIANVDTDTILAMKERQESLAKNKSIPWQGKDGYWRAYVIDETKKDNRRLIKRKNKKDVEDEIIKAVRQQEKVTINDLFEEYIHRKMEIDKLKPSSCSTYRQVFERHFVANNWDKRDIRKLSAWDFAEFLDNECSIHSLTPQSFGNLKTITRGVLKRASRRHLIDYKISDVFDDIEYRPKSRKYTAEERVFSDEEVSRLKEYMSEHRDVQNLALLIILLSGIRVGECVALRFDNFLTPTLFKVECTEIKYKDGDEWVYVLSDTTKTDAGQREVTIDEEFAWILPELQKLNPNAEFICTNKKGDRMTTNCLRRRLKRICEKLGFKYNKATHCCRRTYLTNASYKGYDPNVMKNIAGHTDIRTTQRYIYPQPEALREAKQDMSNNVYNFSNYCKVSNA